MDFKDTYGTIVIKKEEIWVEQLNEHFRGQKSFGNRLEKEAKGYLKDMKRDLEKQFKGAKI